MTKPVKQLLYWTPRVLSILVVIYACKNVPDYVRAGMGFWDAVPAVLSHLIPALILAAVLALSWRREWIVGALFIVIAVLREAKDWSQSRHDHLWLVLLALLIGVLFLLNWKYRAEIRPNA